MDAKWEPKPGQPPPIPRDDSHGTPAPNKVLPPAKGRPGTVRSGGTSVASSLPIPLIAGGAGVLLLIIIIAVVAGGDDKSAAPAADAAPPDVEAARRADDLPPLPQGPSDELRHAVYQLSEAFKAEKVVSSVKLATAQPSVVLISSVYCTDQSLREILSKHSPALRSLGVTLVKCFSRDGQVVFEKQL